MTEEGERGKAELPMDAGCKSETKTGKLLAECLTHSECSTDVHSIFKVILSHWSYHIAPEGSEQRTAESAVNCLTIWNLDRVQWLPDLLMGAS